MTLKLTKAALFGLFLCALYISTAHAGRALDIPDIEKHLSPAPTCSGAVLAHIQPSSIYLHKADQKNIELARAFTAHLDKKGQDSRVIKSIFKASLQSGVDFEMLLMKAIMESDLGRLNVAAKSSARGVFQYIEPTWLVLMKRYGAQIGYPEYAQAINITRNGLPYFKGSSQYLRPEILALRYDPDMAALIKAHQVKEETDVIRGMKNGGKVTATDHYIAHMLGLSLAREFYDLKSKNSILAVATTNTPGLREATRLNRAFFYDGKRALTAPQSYRKFENRVGREMRRINAVATTKPEALCAPEITRTADIN